MGLKEDISRWLLALHEPDDIIEIRAPGDTGTLSGYFRADDPDIGDAVMQFKNITLYQTLNQLKPELHSRDQRDRIIKVGKKQPTTSDGDVDAYRWILVDVDPVRPAGLSASDAEKAEALAVIKRIYASLKASGLKEPIIADSGNGYHLLYRVDMPVDKGKIVIKAFLEVLDMTFSTNAAHVDTTVFNPARITKLYGTVAVKGANTKERPWRRSCIKHIPDVIEVTDKMVITRIASEKPTEEQERYFKHNTRDFDVREFLDRHGVRVAKEVSYSGGVKLVLEECPFNSAHKAPDSAVFISSSGSLGFKCLHNGCAGRHWHDVREALDPEAYVEETGYKRLQHPRSADWYAQRNQSSSAPIEPTQDPLTAFLDVTEIPPVDKSKIITVRSGIRQLDEDLGGGFNLGELSIWTGRNGSGKSTLLEQIALEAVDQGYNAIIYSGELKKERVKDWIYLQAAGPEGVIKRDNCNYYDVLPERFKQIDEGLKDKLFLYNNSFGSEVDTIINAMRAGIVKHSARVVVIDNLMSMDFGAINGNNDLWNAQSRLIKDMKRVAEETNCHVHFVCHPRKGGRHELLTRYDISGSGDITNAADNVLFVYRTDKEFEDAFRTEYKLTSDKAVPSQWQAEVLMRDSSVFISKNRDRGVTDRWYPLHYNAKCRTISDYADGIRPYKWQTIISNNADEFTEAPFESWEDLLKHG